MELHINVEMGYELKVEIHNSELKCMHNENYEVKQLNQIVNCIIEGNIELNILKEYILVIIYYVLLYHS